KCLVLATVFLPTRLFMFGCRYASFRQPLRWRGPEQTNPSWKPQASPLGTVYILETVPPILVTQILAPSNAAPKIVLPAGSATKVPRFVPSLARSFVTLPDEFLTQMLFASKDTTSGWLLTTKVPCTAASSLRRFVTLLPYRC